MLKNATFRQLCTLDAVARLGSVSRAASELHLTQPAISIQLKLLEECSGTPLLQRDGRGICLTSAGVQMALYARRILDLWREASDEMATYQGVFAGTLRVGAVTTAEYLLPPLLVTFASKYPSVKVKLSVGNRDEIVRMLAGNKTDIAVMGQPPVDLNTVAIPFAKHPMAFIAAPAHPLMSAHNLTLSELAATSLLVREHGSGTRTTLERLFKNEGIPLHDGDPERLGSELSSNEAIKQMCIAGFGVAFLSMHTCSLELETGLLKLLPLTPNPVEREWYAIHLASRHLPKVAIEFEHFLSVDGQQHVKAHLRHPTRTATLAY